MQFTSEHIIFQNSARQFIAKEIDPHIGAWEAAGIFPAQELFRKMRALGFLDVYKPVEYGGLGLDCSYEIAFCEAIGGIGAQGVSMALAVQTDMATPALARFGSDELRREFLRLAIEGEQATCIGVSETDAGSYVASLNTRARNDGGDEVMLRIICKHMGILPKR